MAPESNAPVSDTTECGWLPLFVKRTFEPATTCARLGLKYGLWSLMAMSIVTCCFSGATVVVGPAFTVVDGAVVSVAPAAVVDVLAPNCPALSWSNCSDDSLPVLVSDEHAAASATTA